MKTKKCVICKKEYIQKYWNQKTCSLECRKQYIKQFMYNYNQINKIKLINQKRNKIIGNSICSNCNKEYLIKSNNRYSKFCSRKCFYENSKISRLGILNPSYRDGLYIGKNRNVHNFKYRLFEKNCKLLDEKLINEKGYRFCEECGTSNSLRFEHHHLIFRSEKPKHKELHNINNILHLCINCHNKFHKNKLLRNKYIFQRGLIKLFGGDILQQTKSI